VQECDLAQRFLGHHEGAAQFVCELTALGLVLVTQQSEIDQRVGTE